MKTLRVDFSKGINAVTDRRLMPEGYLTIADNVDLRSGSIRPFNFPSVYAGGSSITSGWIINTTQPTCIFEYKGNWIASARYRDYEAETVSSQNRIYFTEEGVSGQSVVIPQKIVNGIQAQLGANVPITALGVKTTTSLAPQLTVVASNTGGSLATGQYSYRVAAIINGQIAPAGPATIVSIPAPLGVVVTTGSISISWNAISKASGYVIFGRSPNNEQTLYKVGGGTTSYIDNGSNGPSGQFASSYDVVNPFTYVYTYQRLVGGMVDESGPSPVSPAISSSQGRNITRFPSTDGFYAGATSIAVTSVATSSVTNAVQTYAGSYPNNTVGVVWVTLNSAIPVEASPTWMTNGGQIVFFGSESTPFDYTLPPVLAVPSAPTLTPSSTGGSMTGAGGGTSYRYAIVAVRGNATISSPAITGTAVYTAATLTSTSTGSILVKWTAVSGADGYIVCRSDDGGTTYHKAIALQGQVNSFTDTAASYSTVISPFVNNDTGATVSMPSAWSAGWKKWNWNFPIPTRNGRIVAVHGNIADITAAIALSTFAFSSTMALCITNCTGASGITDQDVVLVSGASQASLNGVRKAYVPSSGTPTLFWVPVYTTSTDTFTILDQTKNKYYTNWNIYRAGDTGTAFSLVSSQPIDKTTYDDILPTTALGGVLGTEYLDSSGTLVVYGLPPQGLHSPCLFNEMLFGIDGNTVRWTPTGVPDAWPENYSQTFAYPPLRLMDFAGGIIVFCEDNIYRIDGFDPSQLSVHKTRADGCIAPYSPRILGSNLLYLARRGVMSFNGMDADCITESTLPFRVIVQPSNFPKNSYQTSYVMPRFWFYPTWMTAQYAQLIRGSGSQISVPATSDPSNIPSGFAPIANLIANDYPIAGVIWDIRSFTWNNRYFLYFRSPLYTSAAPSATTLNNNYACNTTWCIDMGSPGMPVTTMGMKPVDSHVTSTGETYVLFNDQNLADLDSFLNAQEQFSTSFSDTGSTYSGIVCQFNPVIGDVIPMHIRTAEITAGTPNVRKRWQEIRIFGDGSCQVRVFIDGVLTVFGNGNNQVNITCSEMPLHPARVLLPIGSWGYSASVEIVGKAPIRLIEISYDMMPGDE